MTYYISCQANVDRAVCQKLEQQFHLVHSDEYLPRLEVQEQGLVLLCSGHQPLLIDWNQSQWMQRARGQRGRDPLVKISLAAQGVKVLDLTAGWGRDALVMAHAGARVHLLEQHPYLAALLQQAQTRCQAHEIHDRITIQWIEAKTYLRQLLVSDYPDVIYYDPMHPVRQKTALVKKDLQILQQLVPPNTDVLECIQLAKMRCLKRVVVKWPQKQAPLLEPDFSITGKTIRFDVYLAPRLF
jgi:16S rRNA (guanine1516-N2)-methyltransferase